MELITYKNASQVPEEFLPSLIDAQIECWWSKPFDEFKICNNNWCRAIYSIEDIYWSLEKYKSSEEQSLNFECLECWSETDFIYKKQEFLKIINEYFKDEVSLILVLNWKNLVEWFWLLKISSIESIVNLELSTRPNSYKKNYIAEKISSNLYWSNNFIQNKIICLHHIYTSPNIRNTWFWMLILKEMLKIMIEKWLSWILETRFDSKWYLIAKAIWFEELCVDKYWYVLMYIKQIRERIDLIIKNVVLNLKENNFTSSNFVNTRKFYF